MKSNLATDSLKSVCAPWLETVSERSWLRTITGDTTPFWGVRRDEHEPHRTIRLPHRRVVPCTHWIGGNTGGVVLLAAIGCRRHRLVRRRGRIRGAAERRIPPSITRWAERCLPHPHARAGVGGVHAESRPGRETQTRADRER